MKPKLHKIVLTLILIVISQTTLGFSFFETGKNEKASKESASFWTKHETSWK